MNVSGFEKPIRSFYVESCAHIIVGNMRLRLTPRAAFFHVEHVNRNVLRPRPLESVEVFSPDFEALMWQAGDQVDIDVVEPMFAERLHIAKDVGRAVQPSGMSEIFITERLHAQADAIYTCRAIPL